MKKILISRHNGIGDIVMSIPFIFGLPTNEYDITFETNENNFKLIQYLIPNLKLKNIMVSPFNDYRITEEGYDILINLNRTIVCNSVSWVYKDLDALQLNQQILNYFIFALRGLPTPIELSPSAYIHKEKFPTNKILIFLNGSIANRTIGKKITSDIEKICDNKRIFLNPRYDNLQTLAEEINNAKFVLSVDTGTLHLAEALSTKWFGLFTTMNGSSRVKYYKHGSYIQSNVKCSPCNNHAACGQNCIIHPETGFDCVNGFDSEFLIDKIRENI
jgi:ADP-heptose:LPS heptosyltransferase